MSKIGTADIKGIMLGGTEISKAYLGSEIVFQNAVPAPDGYQWADYIENTSYAYIDTGVPCDTISKIVCVMQLNSLNGKNYGNYMIGSASNAITLMVLNNNRYGAYWNGSVKYDFNNNAWSQKTKITINNGVFTVGATTKTVSTATITNTGLLIFFNGSAKNNNTRAMANMWNAQIYNKSGVLVRDYTPIKKIDGSVYGLWDKINNTFNTSPNGIAFSGG